MLSLLLKAEKKFFPHQQTHCIALTSVQVGIHSLTIAELIGFLKREYLGSLTPKANSNVDFKVSWLKVNIFTIDPALSLSVTHVLKVVISS